MTGAGTHANGMIGIVSSLDIGQEVDDVLVCVVHPCGSSSCNASTSAQQSAEAHTWLHNCRGPRYVEPSISTRLKALQVRTEPCNGVRLQAALAALYDMQQACKTGMQK